MPEALTSAEEKDLQENDPELLTEIEKKRRALEAVLWPEPTLADVLNFYRSQRTMWAAHKAAAARAREIRYLRDETPEKWKRHMETDRRVRTRLSHNEVLRTSANQARNAYKVECRPAGVDPKAVARAKKQTRWCAEFFPAMERASLFPIRRRFVDAQNGDGMGVYEVFLTHRYEEGVDFTERDVEEGEDELKSMRRETSREYLDRTESEILALGECAEIGLRYVDMMAVYVEPESGERLRPGSHGIKRAIIAEKKPYRDVYASVLDRSSMGKLEELRLPKPGDKGWPAEYESWGVSSGSDDTDEAVGLPNDATGDVEHIRYYDAVWYVEVVGGCMVKCERHKLPGVPVFPAFGIFTGSSFLSEAIEGITWGMLDIELAANDLLTYKLDATITYGRPAPVVETAQDGQRMLDQKKEPVLLDLSNPGKARQLNLGQRITDAYKDFRPHIADSDIASLTQLWQMNGLNPIAQGQSPGADAAGYTVNSLMGASLAPYDVLIENEEKVAGQVLDFVRLMIRDTIKERVYLAVPMEDRRVGGTEWLGLGPDDVDETPCRTKIDPLSDANRMAMRESLITGNQGGYISRSRVQREGFNIEDPQAEDLEILEDAAMVKLSSVMIEDVFNELQIGPAQPTVPMGPDGLPITLVGPNGEPLPPSGAGGGRGGPEMADPQPPSVGAERSAASQQFTARARGGQGNGYRPPAGPLNREG